MTGTVFIDLSKAFDSVNHEIILDKLEQSNMSTSVIDWFKGKRGSRFFFLMTLRVPLIHYVDISRRHSHKCVCTIMVINVQNQQFSASSNSSNVTNLAKRSKFC